MKKIILFSAAIILLAASCKKTENNASEQLPDVKASSTAKVCVDKGPNVEPGKVSTESVFVKTTSWANGKTIKVKFLNGTAFLQGKVKQYAKIWEGYANVKFSFVTSGTADLKVGFKYNGDEGSWSYLGTDALTYAPGNEQSMNFGWFDANSPESDFSGTILHEFGHALGLAHEQASPNQNIQWNKPVVYAYFQGPPNNWTKADVDAQVFAKYGKNDKTISYTAYDPASIMQYFIDESFTTDGFSVGENTVLSATDKSHIAKVYPK